MALTPKETDRLLVFVAAELARRRRTRGVLLNCPEAVALIADEIFEEAHAGTLLRRSDVMDGVPEMLRVLHVDARVPDGTRLVTFYSPIGEEDR
jgi:urease gamma subunit